MLSAGARGSISQDARDLDAMESFFFALKLECPAGKVERTRAQAPGCPETGKLLTGGNGLSCL
jgi:hypothetical protein